MTANVYLGILYVTNPPRHIPVLTYVLSDPPVWPLVVYSLLLAWGFMTILLEMLRPKNFTRLSKDGTVDDDDKSVPGEWR